MKQKMTFALPATAASLATGPAPAQAAFIPDPALLHVPNTGSGRLFVSSQAEPKVWIVDACDLSVVGEVPVAEGMGLTSNLFYPQAVDFTSL